jgi:hypothetical protein
MKKPTASHPLKKSQAFYVPIPFSKDRANGLYAKGDESRPHIYPFSLRSTLIRQGYALLRVGLQNNALKHNKIQQNRHRWVNVLFYLC